MKKKVIHDPKCVHYLRAVLTPVRTQRLASALVTLIKNSGLKFDSIVCRGLSGSMIVPIVALRLRKYPIAIRKGEDTHSSNSVEGGHNECKSYIIIDDCIDTGETFKAITTAMTMKHPLNKLVGVFLYDKMGTDKNLGVPTIGLPPVVYNRVWHLK